MANRLCPVDETIPFHREVAQFPGVVDSSIPRISKSLLLRVHGEKQRPNLRMTVPPEWHATDLYVPPEELIEIHLPTIFSPAYINQLSVRVGAHTDFLHPKSDNVKHQKVFKRMPEISEQFKLHPGLNKIRSQYGGSLIFVCDPGEKFTIDITVKCCSCPKLHFGKKGQKLTHTG